MLPGRFHLSILFLSVAAMWSREANASDPAGAQALFDTARVLAGQGKYAEACPKFEESQRLGPGIGTQFNLADCYEKTGRIASAWALFAEVAAKAQAAGQVERSLIAKARGDALKERLPTLTLVVSQEDSKEIKITRDGSEIRPAQWNAAIPIDPGTHTIQIERRTGVIESTQIVADPGTKTQVVVSAAPAISFEKGVVPRERPIVPSPGLLQPTLRKVAVGTALVGIAAATASLIFAIDSANKRDSAEPHCVSGCDEAGFALRTDALAAGDRATGFLVAGASALGLAAVFWLIAPEHAKASAWHRPAAISLIRF